MPRTKAISLLQGPAAPADLVELYGMVIENVQKLTLSGVLKSQLWNGDPAAGSCEFRRFVNSVSKAYGTARTAGKGDRVTAPPVTVNLDQHKEIVEEIANFDLETFGVADIMRRRADNHVSTLVWELDKAFFTAAATAATAFTPTGTDKKAILEQYIQTLEVVQNDYVRGVDRSLMAIVASPAYYGEIRDLLDAQMNPNVDTAAEEFGLYHGVRVYSSVNIPTGTKAIITVQGSVALPALIYQYSEPERIPLSNDSAVSLFYDYGTKALTPDLIYKYASA